MKNLVPIGRFSQLSRLSIKALRYYDEVGLLRPTLVDPDSGYRYYSLAQAVDAEAIRLLRELEVPLDEVELLLRARGGAGVRTLLEQHERRVEARLAENRRILTYLRQLLERGEDLTPYVVRTKTVHAQIVASLRTHTSLVAIGGVTAAGFAELYAHVGRAGGRPAGPPLAVYHGETFREEDVDFEMCVPLAEAVPASDRIACRALPASRVAYTLHPGPYSEIGRGYRVLGEWLQEHGEASSGSPRESYLVGPGQVPHPADYRTEIAWPIADGAPDEHRGV